MNKDEMRRELARLIEDSTVVAPLSTYTRGSETYTRASDDQLDEQRSKRWELEVNAIIGEMASSGAKLFVDLNAEYILLKSKPLRSRSEFIHKAAELVRSARELLDSPLAEFQIGQSRNRTPPIPDPLKSIEPEVPQKVTLQWLFRHVPVPLWVGAAAIVIAAFAAGVRASDFTLVREMFGLLSSNTNTTGPAQRSATKP